MDKPKRKLWLHKDLARYSAGCSNIESEFSSISWLRRSYVPERRKFTDWFPDLCTGSVLFFGRRTTADVGLRELDDVGDGALEVRSPVGERLRERRGVSGIGSPCDSRHINSSLSIDRRLFALDSRSYFRNSCWNFSVSCLHTDTLMTCMKHILKPHCSFSDQCPVTFLQRRQKKSRPKNRWCELVLVFSSTGIETLLSVQQ